MHFILFLPGARTTDGSLDDVGLGDLKAGCHTLPIHSGPDGNPGLLISWRTNSGLFQLTYAPDRQIWIPGTGGPGHPPGSYWLGWSTASPPSPEDLLRETPFRGVSVTLGDGCEWTFPRVSQVPRDLVRGDCGEILLMPQPRFAQFCIAADRWQAALAQLPPGGGVALNELMEFAELALRVNYRITPELASQRRLWSSGAEGTVARAVVAMLLPEGGGL